MAALAADVNCSAVGKTCNLQLSANGADTFYRGAIVFSDATNGGVQAVPAAGDRAVGVIPYQQTTTASGDEVEVIVEGFVWLPVGTNITAADEGNVLTLDIGTTQSDNPADFESAEDLTLAANDVAAGRIIRVTSTQMLVYIGPGVTGGLGTANTDVHFE